MRLHYLFVVTNLKFDLHHLRAFRAVAIAGNFTSAAAELGYAQSTVTYLVQSLERKLGASLFERSRFSKTTVLTDAGRRVLDYAERLLALAEETTAAIRN
jgi:DNA-binding transcriptional LysR family regulator